MILLISAIIFSSCDATDKNFEEKDNSLQTDDINAWNTSELASKFEKISHQVDLYIASEHDTHKMFVENLELSPSPSKSVEIYGDFKKEFFSDQNVEQNEEVTDEKEFEEQIFFVTDNNQMQNQTDQMSDIFDSSYSSSFTNIDARIVNLNMKSPSMMIDDTIILTPKKSPMHIHIPKLNLRIRIQKFWEHLSEETQTKIMASLC